MDERFNFNNQDDERSLAYLLFETKERLDLSWKEFGRKCKVKSIHDYVFAEDESKKPIRPSLNTLQKIVNALDLNIDKFPTRKLVIFEDIRANSDEYWRIVKSLGEDIIKTSLKLPGQKIQRLSSTFIKEKAGSHFYKAYANTPKLRKELLTEIVWANPEKYQNIELQEQKQNRNKSIYWTKEEKDFISDYLTHHTERISHGTRLPRGFYNKMEDAFREEFPETKRTHISIVDRGRIAYNGRKGPNFKRGSPDPRTTQEKLEEKLKR